MNFKPEDYRKYLLDIARAYRSSDGRHLSTFEIEELVQETLVKTHERLFQCNARTESEFKGWLKTTLKNLIFDLYRKKKRQPQPVNLKACSSHSSRGIAYRDIDQFVAEQTTIGTRLDKERLRLRTSDLINTLPINQRQAMRLKYFQDWSMDQIAEHLNKTKPAVAGLLRRGLQTLNEQFDQL